MPNCMSQFVEKQTVYSLTELIYEHMFIVYTYRTKSVENQALLYLQLYTFNLLPKCKQTITAPRHV